jgi:hypothetical protein
MKTNNLFTCGVVALDAKNGELKGYHQFLKSDFHDVAIFSLSDHINP